MRERPPAATITRTFHRAHNRTCSAILGRCARERVSGAPLHRGGQYARGPTSRAAGSADDCDLRPVRVQLEGRHEGDRQFASESSVKIESAAGFVHALDQARVTRRIGHGEAYAVRTPT